MGNGTHPYANMPYRSSNIHSFCSLLVWPKDMETNHRVIEKEMAVWSAMMQWHQHHFICIILRIDLCIWLYPKYQLPDIYTSTGWKHVEISCEKKNATNTSPDRSVRLTLERHRSISPPKPVSTWNSGRSKSFLFGTCTCDFPSEGHDSSSKWSQAIRCRLKKEFFATFQH